MINNQLTLNSSPTQSDLIKIEKWLIDEEKNFNEGFYCEWQLIEKSFRINRLITLNFNKSPIGLLVWAEGEIYVKIEIIEINPLYRNKGLESIS